MWNCHPKRNVLVLLLAASGLAASPWLCAQEANPTEPQTQPDAQPSTPAQLNSPEPVYKVQVVAREIPAINYFHRDKTKIGFVGTALLPQAHGWAEVSERNGRTAIEAHLDGLTPATRFGPEYLTYVLWAITPEGRPVNLGELLTSGDKYRADTSVTTDLQSFGLIVTAEPYFAVLMPSDLVVSQNYVQKDTAGVIQQVNAHYSLLPRGAYASIAGRHETVRPVQERKHAPLDLYEAENAVNIAEAGNAQTYAPSALQNAQRDLQNAEQLNEHHHHMKEEIAYARNAVQTAEDARLMTIRKIKAQDEEAQLKARQNAQEEAQQAKLNAQKEDLERQKAVMAQQQAQQQAQQAQEAQQQAAEQRQQAQQARQQAEQQARQAQQQAQQAQQQAQKVSQQEKQLREQLKNQLSQVLQTRETARGLIVNMNDVLFGFNKYNLKPEARVKLAKVSGILLAYPQLKLQVEGYTDDIGSASYNQKLSEKRADSVRDFLIDQNVPANNITSEGYGESDPVASNSTAQGRAENRRVELVVSGNAIGVPQQQQPGSTGQNQPAPPPQPGASGQGSQGKNAQNSARISNPQ
jgi:outer membrane protein OmpA-like peptidoglycan-associated protein